jgi:hypothetical protein
VDASNLSVLRDENRNQRRTNNETARDTYREHSEASSQVTIAHGAIP